ncbi:MAG: DNA topoisomerase IV subunit A [Deltaproteobacteria bacterium]|nr:MAG: DNA topoisomerase IV subunit A [Deltaproteobacteria bacterium]
MDVTPVPLHEATRERYLAYALSVVTSRALPDVRDGLKPVQRRILYTMFNELGLRPDSRYRKCAAVVGEVMGKFHPHGDQAIYDALVRMAQDFTLRAALVEGHGNFGSLDGDRAAAMRYTECRLQPIALELLSEIKKRTVDFRPNYDGQRFEPVVLPAQFPQLLVNGSEGIAVGMATRIPPHNLGEVIDAAVHLIAHPDATVADLVQHVSGPDFPTAGRILNDRAEIISFYQEGQGSFRIRCDWHEEKDGRRRRIVLTSVPYGQNKARMIEKIAAEITSKRLPQVVDMRDESTEDTRVVLELKQGASPEAVMAYIFKKTPAQATFPMNLTALVPSAHAEITKPARLDLRAFLDHWLTFRFETIRRRFEYDLHQLRERIHLLEGFVLIFDALDEVIQIIRASQGRRDAHERLIDRFDLSDAQTEAILELRLYRLAQLEILLVQQELDEKRAEAERIEGILGSDKELWIVVRDELLEIRKLYADPRRTVLGEPVRELTFDENAYIIDEDAYVVVTRDGWIKRQSSFSEVDKIRIRDEDEIGWLIKASTRSTLTFFGSAGRAYVMRVDDVPATTGYGEPVQAHFSFDDGERVIGVLSHDPRHLPEGEPFDSGEDPSPPWVIALTEQGRALRFALADHAEISTKRGRMYARLSKKDAVFVALLCQPGDRLALATTKGRAMIFPTDEVSVLKAAGKGVAGIKLRESDRVMAADLVHHSLDGPTVITALGRELVVRERKFGVSSRGNRGSVVLKRGTIDRWVRGPTLQLGSDDDPVDDDHAEEDA